jgi:rfaE bifunctional protein nucleotidyltransferase chain/domain
MNKIYKGFSEELKAIIDKAKASNKRIVFTNGCFDIIHKGHVRYLRQAKALGDVLIVGLNSDSSVRRIKPGRPINPEDDRAEVLSSLEMVDYVVIFDEDTPYELIRFLRPHILVKGGDWKVEDIIGSDLVEKTVSLPYVEGVSTTEIIKKIKKCLSFYDIILYD